MPVTLRQRVVEYELCNMMNQIDARLWNDIREVASPITGLFAPVSFAVRQGWIQLGRRNEYIDPTTGHAIPLETALAQGRLRFASSRDAIETSEVNSSLVLTERESLSWQFAEATHVLNTSTRLHVPINQARAEGFIRVDENSRTWVLDVRSNLWLAAEDAVSQNILIVEETTTIARTTEEMEMIRRTQLQQPVVRAYHVNAIRPGGEPAEWLKPEEAAQLGLFNWQTGEVAVDWPSRPLTRRVTEDQEIRTSEHFVTQWCHFLTARQAGWIRLIPEHNFNRWVPLSQSSEGNSNRRLLSSSVTLISSTEETSRSRAYRFETTESRRQNIRQRYEASTATRQYQTFPLHPPMSTGSQSPEERTEYSGSHHFLTDVGGFEHSDVYVLPSQRQTQLELSEEYTESSSIQQFARLPMHQGGLGDVQVFEHSRTEEEHAGEIHSGFEELNVYSSSQHRSHQHQQQVSRTWAEREQALIEGEHLVRTPREQSQPTSGPIAHGASISTISQTIQGGVSQVTRLTHSQQQRHQQSQHSFQDHSTSSFSTPNNPSRFPYQQQ